MDQIQIVIIERIGRGLEIKGDLFFIVCFWMGFFCCVLTRYYLGVSVLMEGVL
jgi:hypothetical protein